MMPLQEPAPLVPTSRPPPLALEAPTDTLTATAPPRLTVPETRPPPADEDLQRLSQAAEEGRGPGFDAGVLEDWRTVLELVAAQNSRLGAVD